MITIKSLIKYNNANYIEVTWVETIEEVETVIHCQAYADVQMDMLRADALKYNTSLDKYEDIIKEVESNIVLPTPEEIAEQERLVKLSECYAYLNSTDYKMTVDYFATLTESEQAILTTKRVEARQFIRDNK